VHLVALSLVLCLSAGVCQRSGAAGDKILPPNANAYGKSLGQWLEAYWRWSYTSNNTEPFQSGPVAFMPLPAGAQTGGDITNPDDPAYYKGAIEVTLRPGTPFVLPAFALLWERYQGWPDVLDDVPLPDEVMNTTITDQVVTLDGKPILQDFWAYFVSRAFDPMLVYSQPTGYGAVGSIYFQGVGFVAAPLTPGQHTLKLYERYVVPGWWAVIYDNTWVINVVPPGRAK